MSNTITLKQFSEVVVNFVALAKYSNDYEFTFTIHSKLFQLNYYRFYTNNSFQRVKLSICDEPIIAMSIEEEPYTVINMDSLNTLPIEFNDIVPKFIDLITQLRHNVS